ncbi:MAG: M48 family metallopeptidase [Cyanobacteria bacterium J06631_2]
MKYKPKELPENINVTPVKPLVNFAYLLGTVVVFGTSIYLVLGVIATQLAIRMSPQMEIKIGKQILATIPTVNTPDNLPQRQYLANLLAALPQESLNHAVPLTVYIQKHEYPNAFIIPGGHIIFTTAFLAEAESENELAFVMAHEIGHHLHKDTLKGLGRSLVFLTVASAIGIGSGNADLVTFTGSIADLHYSRQQESAADIYALSTMIDFYGHGNASLDFFKRIHTKNKDKSEKLNAYFSTHPATQTRIDNLNQFAQSKGWKMKGKITKLPERLFSQKTE